MFKNSENKSMQEIANELNAVSSTFCLAKWKQLTLNLQTGTYSSCCLTGHEKINPNLSEKLNNYAKLLKEREDILDGKQVESCNYCWEQEDNGEISERYVKSSSEWALPYLDEIKNSKSIDSQPTYVEVSFSNKCQFKCTYCSSSFSSKWYADAKKHGPYPTTKGHHDLEWSTNELGFYNENEHNPHVDHFFNWLDKNIDELEVIRVTGGEPLIIDHTYKLLEEIKNKRTKDVSLIFNSNLGLNKNIIDKFISALKDVKQIKKLTLITSIESWDEHAEYIRNGLKVSQFKDNIEYLLQEFPDIDIRITSTVNILSLFKMKPFLEYVYNLKNQYQTYDKILVSFYPLIDPSCFSVSNGTQDLKDEFNKIVNWLEERFISDEHPYGFNEYELYGVQNILNLWGRNHNQTNMADFYLYFREYDKRNGTRFEQTFPELKSFMNQAYNAFHSKFNDLIENYEYIDGPSSKFIMSFLFKSSLDGKTFDYLHTKVFSSFNRGQIEGLMNAFAFDKNFTLNVLDSLIYKESLSFDHVSYGLDWLLRTNRDKDLLVDIISSSLSDPALNDKRVNNLTYWFLNIAVDEFNDLKEMFLDILLEMMINESLSFDRLAHGLDWFLRRDDDLILLVDFILECINISEISDKRINSLLYWYLSSACAEKPQLNQYYFDFLKLLDNSGRIDLFKDFFYSSYNLATHKKTYQKLYKALCFESQQNVFDYFLDRKLLSSNEYLELFLETDFIEMKDIITGTLEKLPFSNDNLMMLEVLSSKLSDDIYSRMIKLSLINNQSKSLLKHYSSLHDEQQLACLELIHFHIKSITKSLDQSFIYKLYESIQDTYRDKFITYFGAEEGLLDETFFREFRPFDEALISKLDSKSSKYLFNELNDANLILDFINVTHFNQWIYNCKDTHYVHDLLVNNYIKFNKDKKIELFTFPTQGETQDIQLSIILEYISELDTNNEEDQQVVFHVIFHRHDHQLNYEEIVQATNERPDVRLKLDSTLLAFYENNSQNDQVSYLELFRYHCQYQRSAISESFLNKLYAATANEHRYKFITYFGTDLKLLHESFFQTQRPYQNELISNLNQEDTFYLLESLINHDLIIEFFHNSNFDQWIFNCNDNDFVFDLMSEHFLHLSNLKKIELITFGANEDTVKMQYKLLIKFLHEVIKFSPEERSQLFELIFHKKQSLDLYKAILAKASPPIKAIILHWVKENRKAQFLSLLSRKRPEQNR